jgi:hypothetical protein
MFDTTESPPDHALLPPAAVVCEEIELAMAWKEAASGYAPRLDMSM